jgi:glycerophosphoryl diester phosphodiesterase
MTPLVIAHRGASWKLPANSLAAFERAVQMGADYVEVDVRHPRGMPLVCAHDPVRRDAAAEYTTLEEALEVLGGRVRIAVDIKQPHAVGPAMEALDAHGIPDEELLVMSTRRLALEPAGTHRPGARLLLHLSRARDPRDALGFWGVSFWNPVASAERIASAQSAGFAVAVYTVNEPARMRELASLGVGAIITDRPDLLRATLDDLRAEKERAAPTVGGVRSAP